jgi:hypothetical protein
MNQVINFFDNAADNAADNDIIEQCQICQDNIEQCPICHEHLHNAPTYCLPECKHTFHTSCIISWFRLGDTLCPYCRHKGVNFCSKKYGRDYGFLSIADGQRMKDLRAYARRSDANPIVKKKFENLTKINKQLQEFNKEYAEFDKKLRTSNYEEFEGKSITDLIKIGQNMRTRKRNFRYRIHRAERAIIQLPVVPLIIPLIIDMS